MTGTKHKNNTIQIGLKFLITYIEYYYLPALDLEKQMHYLI